MKYDRRNPGRLEAMSAPAVRAVPLLNLRAQHDEIRAEIREAVERVIDSQQFILGPEVGQFERCLAEYCGVEHAIGCASGSDAVLLALKAARIGPGDEVITTPYTFFATAGAIIHAGARPVFADIEPVSFNLDPARFEEAAKQHPKARAVIPVHLFGACAQMDAIGEVARGRQMVIIEDAAQAIGAEHNGTRAGALSMIACFSFFPTKNLGAFGDGGALTTRDAELAARLRVLRAHGSRERYCYEAVGYNSRLDALQAAVLSVKLRYLDAWTAARQRNADLYRQRLAGAGFPITLPSTQPWQSRHVYHHFNIRAARRDALREFLIAEGIGAEIYYPKPLHLQECFGGLGYRAGDFPEAERLASEALALPVHSELREGDIDAVAEAIQRFYRT
jgi:dTDP-4-amino-4,6-dideoxygalactose transaminase